MPPNPAESPSGRQVRLADYGTPAEAQAARHDAHGIVDSMAPTANEARPAPQVPSSGTAGLDARLPLAANPPHGQASLEDLEWLRRDAVGTLRVALDTQSSIEHASVAGKRGKARKTRASRGDETDSTQHGSLDSVHAGGAGRFVPWISCPACQRPFKTMQGLAGHLLHAKDESHAKLRAKKR